MANRLDRILRLVAARRRKNNLTYAQARKMFLSPNEDTPEPPPVGGDVGAPPVPAAGNGITVQVSVDPRMFLRGR